MALLVASLLLAALAPVMTKKFSENVNVSGSMGSYTTKQKTKEIELYSTGRYAALTGNAVNPIDLSEAQQRIDILYNYCNRGKKQTENTRRIPQCVMLLSEREIIEKAENGRNGQVFSDLLNGNWKCLGIGDGTQSSADLKFANMLKI